MPCKVHLLWGIHGATFNVFRMAESVGTMVGVFFPPRLTMIGAYDEENLAKGPEKPRV